MIKKYISLTKPGIIGGNVIVAVGGFFLASAGHPALSSLVAMVVGLSLVIASSCVFNNYIDRDIDAKMFRTQSRALIAQTISPRNAIVFACILLMLGTLTLVLFTNYLTAGVALFGFFVYVFVYSLWAKRSTEYATEIGSIAGAVPPVVGYCAVTNTLDLGALTLFVILCFWQMPHFFAIALRRMDEYAAASIPVLPVKKGIQTTKVRMMLYIVLFGLATVFLAVFGLVGYAYLVVMIPASLLWLGVSLRSFWVQDTRAWARKTFLFSLIVLLLFSVMISLDPLF